MKFTTFLSKSLTILMNLNGKCSINFVEFHSANEFELVREVMETIEKEIGVSIENHSATDLILLGVCVQSSSKKIGDSMISKTQH